MDRFVVFFVLYGIGHLGGGLAIWVAPSVLDPVLPASVSPAASTLLGMLSMMVGFGFCGAALASTVRARRIVIGLGALSNAVNAAGHLMNASAGHSPVWVYALVAVGCGGLMLGLVALMRSPGPRGPASSAG